jgi:cytochrome c553
MRSVLKWIGIVLGGLIGLIVVAVLATYLIGQSRLMGKVTVPEETFSAEGGDAAHGHNLALTNGCTQCHGPDLGGTKFIDNQPPFGYLPAPNLTSGEGGAAAEFSDADFERAIRHGVDPEGRRLMIMPSQLFHPMADSDLKDLIAYIRSADKVDQDLGEPKYMPLAFILTGAGVLPSELQSYNVIDHEAAHIAVPPTDDLALGAYHAGICTECHGEKLNGGPLPFDPTTVADNLTPGGDLKDWSEDDFRRAMREGVTPEGRTLNADEMPWPSFSVFTDAEIHAQWVYLQSLEALPMGGATAAP